jgi:hypothetical protein
VTFHYEKVALTSVAAALLMAQAPHAGVTVLQDQPALLGFHLSTPLYSAVTPPPPETSQAMFDSYPQDIRTWLQQKGGLEKMPHGAERI